MKIEPFYCDMHIHTYQNANRRDGTTYDIATLFERLREGAKGHRAVISLTDHNVINKDAYEKALAECGDDIILILGVELHVKSNGPKPYHAHAYFNADLVDLTVIDRLNALLDRLYPDKLPSKDNQTIPQLPEILNELRDLEFLFLPHGGQSHSTFDNAVAEGELCDNVMMRSVYYNTFDGFTARSNSNVEATERYFKQIGIDEFTSLLTGSDNYDPSRYPEPKSNDAEEFIPTWVFAEPSFDGLRMALSENTRLYYSTEPPEGFVRTIPSIEHIEMHRNNIDIDVELSPGLNVIIGGSSTGKTLLLEAIARRSGILDDGEAHVFYDKFGIDGIELRRNDQTSPYYINQSYISKVVDKSVDRETIDSIQILKDVFPQDQDASEGLDANFSVVRDLVTRMFAAAEAVQQAEQALRRLSAPSDLITVDSLDGNPISALEPSAELKGRMAWKSATERKVDIALKELEEMFDANPLLPPINAEVTALRKKISLGKEMAIFEQQLARLLHSEAEAYSTAESNSRRSDTTKRENLESVLKNIVTLRNGLKAFGELKDQLLSQEFEDVPRTDTLAGHQLSVVYSFKMSAEALLQAINDVLNTSAKFDSIEALTAEKLADSLHGVDGRRSGIRSLASMAVAVAANLEKNKKRTFSIKTKNGQYWNDLSEGRKTAVLLDLILGFDGNPAPLIIDQPEDNLAADYINDGLATAIKGSKATRQTIVVTHNATIPMLADAQTVVLCRSIDGKLVIRSAPLEGSIDGKRALDWIVEITDGGEPSVQKRFRKYNFRRFGGRQ